MNRSDLPAALLDFSWAVVRLATYFPESGSRPILVFGWVQILERDRPKPASTEVETLKIASGRGGKIFFRKTALSLGAALAWYRSGGPQILTPVSDIDSAKDAKAPLEAVSVEASDFFDDPTWPDLGVPLGSDALFGPGGPGDPAPFMGAASKGSRLHRRLGSSAGIETLANDELARKFLGRRLHVDLRDYPEYLGGIALTVPNPIIRGVAHYLVPGEGERPEKVVYRLSPQRGKTLDGLTLTILERRANILSRFEPVPVPADGLIIRESPRTESTGYVVSHIQSGILAYQAPLPFIRSINIATQAPSRRVRIQAKKTDSPQSEDADYDVFEPSTQPVFGRDTIKTNPYGPILAAEGQRVRRAQAARYDQTWFEDNQRDAVLSFIRNRIGRARNYVMVADPYFGARQIQQFLHAVQRLDVELKILTSRLAFREFSKPEEEIAASTSGRVDAPLFIRKRAEAQRIRSFTTALSSFQTRGIQKVATRVLLGSVPLHDRFLVVDDSVWFLGNSLNALGIKASLILQVPDGDPIVQKLSEMYYRATPWSEFASWQQPGHESPI